MPGPGLNHQPLLAMGGAQHKAERMAGGVEVGQDKSTPSMGQRPGPAFSAVLAWSALDVLLY